MNMIVRTRPGAETPLTSIEPNEKLHNDVRKEISTANGIATTAALLMLSCSALFFSLGRTWPTYAYCVKKVTPWQIPCSTRAVHSCRNTLELEFSYAEMLPASAYIRLAMTENIIVRLRV